MQPVVYHPDPPPREERRPRPTSTPTKLIQARGWVPPLTHLPLSMLHLHLRTNEHARRIAHHLYLLSALSSLEA